MSTTIINPDTLHDPTGFGYSHVAFASTGTGPIYIGGQYASDITGHTTSTDFASQVRQSFDNLGLALRAAGLDDTDVMRIGPTSSSTTLPNSTRYSKWSAVSGATARPHKP